MKIADTLNVSAGEFDFTLMASGEYAATVSRKTTPVFQLARINTAGFSGALSLPEKLRCHRTHDNLCAEFDSETVIPFGCEYKVKRHWTVFNNIALLNCDIAADNGGTIRDLELEPLEITLTPAKVEFLINGETGVRCVENADGELYCGNAAVLMLRVTSNDGLQAEYICGDDLWRHCAAEKISGVSSHFQIVARPEKVILLRKVLISSEEAVMEKRPWKFKSIFSWSNAEAPAAQFPAEKIDNFVVSGCFAAASAHRELRKVVRSAAAGKLLVMQGDFPHICDDPSHLERPAKHPVAHSDLGAAAADYLWANRELAKRNSQLAMKSSSQLYGNSVVLKNLSRTDELIRFVEE